METKTSTENTAKQTAKEAVRTLIYGSGGIDSNLIEFKQDLKKAVRETSNWTILGNFIDDNAYKREIEPNPVILDKPESTASQEAKEIFKKNQQIEDKKFEFKLNIYLKRQSELDDAKQSLWQFIYNRIDENSKTNLQHLDNWKEIQDRTDPLELINTLEKTHLNARPGIDQRDAVNALSLVGDSLKMTSTESLSSFEDRFKNTLKQYSALGGPKLIEKKKAYLFLDKLDMKRFHEIKRTLDNEADGGTAYPQTVVLMMDRVSRWQATQLSLSSRLREDRAEERVNKTREKTFNTQERGRPNNYNNAGKFNKHNWNKEKPNLHKGGFKPNNDTKGPNDKLDRDRRRPFNGRGAKPDKSCTFCERTGHSWHECRHYLKAKEFQKRSNEFKSKRREERVHAIRGEIKDETTQDEDDYYAWGKSVTRNRVNATREKKFDPNQDSELTREEIILDTGSAFHMFNNKKLLKNLRNRERPLVWGGALTGDSKCFMKGDFLNFGEVNYDPKVQTNILSFALLTETNTVTYTPTDEETGAKDFYTVTPKEGEAKQFKRKGKYYVLKAKELNNRCFTLDQSERGTYESNPLQLKKHELLKVEEVRKAVRTLGLPGPATLIRQVKYGMISDLPFSKTDVYNCIRMHGQDLGAIKGKTNRHPQESLEREDEEDEDAKIETRKDQEIHIDIMFVEKIPFLISVSKPLTYLMATRVDSKAAEHIERGLMGHISAYKARRFNIVMIRSDGECGVINLQTKIEALGIVVDIAGPGMHVPLVETYIRVIKQRARGIFHMLPFNLPIPWIEFLIYFAVSRINMEPKKNQVENTSPTELFQGRRPNWKHEGRCGFGELVEARNPYPTNGMEERTTTAISLYPSGDLQGTWRLFSMKSTHIFRASHFFPQTMTQIYIDKVNEYARRMNKRNLVEFVINPTRLIPEDERVRVRDTLFSVPQTSAFDPLLRTEPLREPSQGAGSPTTPDASRIGLGTTRTDQGASRIVPGNPQTTSGASSIRAKETTERLGDQMIQKEQDPKSEQALDPILQEKQSQSIQEINKFLSTGAQRSSDTTEFNERDEELITINDPQINHPPREKNKMKNKKNKSRTVSEKIDGRKKDAKSTEEKIVTTRSGRIIKSKVSEDMEQHTHKTTERSFNLSIKRAREQHGNAAEEALKKELLQMIEKNVWMPVSPDQDIKVIGSATFLKEKYNASGEMTKLKARTVARGDQQEKIYGEKDSSPTVSITSVIATLALAAEMRREAMTFDVGGAYLNADMEGEPVYMRVNPEETRILCEINDDYRKYVLPNGCVVVRLLKALYGCKQSAKLWYDHFRRFLLSHSYTQSEYDECVFNLELRGESLTLLLHVDDGFAVSTDSFLLQQLEDMMREQFKAITVKRGRVHDFLGATYEFTTQGSLKISMKNYMTDLLSRLSYEGVARRPAESNLFKIEDVSENLSEKEREKFHSEVAALLHVAKKLRNDILLPISFLTTRVQSPTKSDQAKLELVVRYLRGTQHLCSEIISNVNRGGGIIADIDASFITHSDSKGHTGVAITLGEGAVYCESTKQKLVARSSTEAEIIALNQGLSTVIWLQHFLKEQLKKDIQVIVRQDNKSAIMLTQEGRRSIQNKKFINLRLSWIKQEIDSNLIQIHYCPTEEMVADILTKPSSISRFICMSQKLLNYKESDFQSEEKRKRLQENCNLFVKKPKN